MEDYPETINGVCVKVEPPNHNNNFGEEQKSPVKDGGTEHSDKLPSSDQMNGRQTPASSLSSSEFSASGIGQSNGYDQYRKSGSPALSDEFKARLSPIEPGMQTSTPTLNANKAATSYYLSKGGPPSMLGESIYSYAAFNENSYSKMNMMLKNDSNLEHVEDYDETESKLNLTYPGTARPIGKKAHLPKRYKCAMCAYKTRYKSDLNRHVRKHAVAGYNCDICNMPFKTVGNVEFHKRREHADTYVATKQEKKPKFNCKICTFGTMQSAEFTRHVKKHYTAKFSCNLCNRPFLTVGSLLHHKKAIHDITEEFPSTEDLNISSEPNGQNAAIIESDDDNYQPIKEHAENHQTSNELTNGTSAVERIDASETTNGETNNLSEAKDPVATNGNSSAMKTAEAQIENGPIDMSTSHRIQNDSTNEKVNGVESEKYTCQFCDKIFGRKLALHYHMKNVHKMKMAGDESAFLEYDDDYDLALDMSIQDLENSDAVANRIDNFNERDELKHMRHQCPFCAYATNYKSTYDRHVKKHDLECHICHVCKMPFITFGHMQRHIRDNHPEFHQPAMKNGNRKSVSPPKMEYGSIQKPPLRMSIKRDFDKSFPSGIANYQAVSMNGHADVKPDFVTVPSKRKKHMPVQRPLEQGVSLDPPLYGRYAKLVSDFDDFASRPFACALCFYRTKNVDDLTKHTKNHLTGCNPIPVENTARFNMDFINHMQRKFNAGSERPIPEPVHSVAHQNGQHAPTFRKPNKLQDVISKLWSEPPKVEPESENLEEDEIEEEDDSSSQNIADSIVPTFSVHYRKDKTNLTKPYLCLLCRKRFRLLTILKQHFRQTHSESQINTRSYTCSICGDIFNSPVTLQEHYDIQHKMQS